MKITSLEAKNFRTLQDFVVRFSSGYCTISGENNAGKTAIVKIIRHFLEKNDRDVYYPRSNRIDLAKDRTQWVNEGYCEVAITLDLDKERDSEVYFAVERLTKAADLGAVVKISLRERFSAQDSSTLECTVQGSPVNPQEASEILKKIQGSHNLVVHNSTDVERRAYYYFGDTLSEMFDMHLSGDERAKIQEAEKALQSRVKQAAKKHKENLTELLGKLKDKYEVELATIDRSSARLPISVKLTDKSVEVPLSDWGAGTQNRTRVMISVLEAVRLSNADSPENRSTPLVLVEEPESFLHPSAQAEFGRVLADLAREFNIQILATTHSPYMLNQSDPPANILIERKLIRGKVRAAEVVDVSADNWMQPFSRILGVASDEFPAWHEVFASANSRVILVEGAIDKEYFEFIKEKYPEIYQIPSDVEVVSYGGKDSLKNTQLLKFMIEKFAKIFITFDLDCKDEAERALHRLGLVPRTDYYWIGVESDGAQCLEGLLPDRIRGEVYGKNIALVTKLQSGVTKVRNDASAELKKKYLEAFRSSMLSEKELASFKNLFKIIGKAFS